MPPESNLRARSLTALVALGCTLVAAPAASADSLVYSRDNNIYLANPDGSGSYQVTLDGTAGSPYSSPSQADDGTIVAVRDQKLYRMTQAGRLLNPPVNTPAPGTGAADARVSPDGRLVAYAFATAVRDPLCISCASAEGETLISRSDRFTAADELGRPHLGGWPSWVGNDTLLVNTGSATQWYYKLGRPEAQEWFADYQLGYQDFQTLLDSEVARTGDRLALVRGDHQETLLLLTMRGALPATPAVAGDGCAGFAGPSGRFRDPTWSNDGRTLAWSEDDGIWVEPVPADLAGCPTSLPDPALRIPGAKEPDFGPAPINPGPRPGCGNPGNPSACVVATPTPTTTADPGPHARTLGERLNRTLGRQVAALERLRLRGLLRRRGFQVAFDAPGPGTLSVQLSGPRGAIVAGGRRTVGRAGQTTVDVKLSRTSLKRLRRGRRLAARLTVSFAPRGGTPARASRSLVLGR